ncbi:MAG TPA: hypothetical protein VIK90_01235 [Limnochordales bacterium]
MKGLRSAPNARGPSPWRRAAAWLWSGWEWAFVRLFRLYQVPGVSGPLLRFGLRRWRGRPVSLQDGTRIEPGTWVAEVHISSPRIFSHPDAGRVSLSRLVFTLSAEMRAALRAFASELEAGRVGVPIAALYGKTLLHRAAGRLGFEVHDLPDGFSSRLLAWYERWLVTLYHPPAAASGARREGLKVVWMSTDALLRRFGSRAGAAEKGAGGAAFAGACYTAPGNAEEEMPR